MISVSNVATINRLAAYRFIVSRETIHGWRRTMLFRIWNHGSQQTTEKEQTVWPVFVRWNTNKPNRPRAPS
jgi:hypothetical protein